jgi:hypothetical protein
MAVFQAILRTILQADFMVKTVGPTYGCFQTIYFADAVAVFEVLNISNIIASTLREYFIRNTVGPVDV